MENKKMKLLVAIPDCSVRYDFLPPEAIALLEEYYDITYNELGRNLKDIYVLDK